VKDIVFLGNDEDAIDRVFSLGRREHVFSLGSAVAGVVNDKSRRIPYGACGREICVFHLGNAVSFKRGN